MGWGGAAAPGPGRAPSRLVAGPAERCEALRLALGCCGGLRQLQLQLIINVLIIKVMQSINRLMRLINRFIP